MWTKSVIGAVSLKLAMPHSVALALARTAADVPSLALPAGKAAPADSDAAPGMPRRMAELPSRLDSLPDLASDSCSDSSDSSDDEAPSMLRQRSSRDCSATDGLAVASDGAAAAAMQARGVKRNRSDPPLPRQPLQWMGCTCHWQVTGAAFVLADIAHGAHGSCEAVHFVISWTDWVSCCAEGQRSAKAPAGGAGELQQQHQHRRDGTAYLATAAAAA